MKSIFSLLKNNIKYLAQNALRIAFAISTVASIYEIAVGKIIDGQSDIYKTIGILILIFVILYVIAFIGTSLWILCRKNKNVFSTDRHSVYVHFEDLLNNELVNNKSIRKWVVITVNRCFDTIINNKLISEKSIHGKVFKSLYDEKKYTRETLQNVINTSLQNKQYVRLTKGMKNQGNLKRYEAGTVVKIDDSSTKSYYLLAMTSIDQNLKAHASKEDFILSIQRLIEYCDNNSQGYPVLMPLLGSGLSRTGIDNYSDILKYIIDAFRINKGIMNCDFHIYIRSEDKQKINFGDL